MKKKNLVFLLAASALLTGCNGGGGTDVPPTPVEDTRKAITFEGNDYAFASGLVDKANEGETITFKVLALSGYEVVNVNAVDASGSTVTLSGDVNTQFSFVMPASDVKITASAQGAYFHIGLEDNTKVVITPEHYEAGAKTVKNFIAGFIVDNNDKIQSGDYVYARAGQEVSILVNSVWFADNLSITVNGKEATKENYFVYNEPEEGAEPTVKYEYNAYKFVMPNGNVSIDVSATEKAATVVPEENDKIDAKTYKIIDDEKVYTNSFYAGETAYVDVSLKEEFKDQYLVSSCNYSFKSTSGYDVTEKETNYSATKVTAGVTYSCNITSFTNYSTDIVFTFNLQELKYVGKEFLGSYYGKEFYGTGTTYNPYSSGSKTMTIDGAGNVNIGTTALTIDDTKLDETNKTIGTLTSKGASERTIHYDGKLAWASYYSYDSTEEKDIYVFIKDVTSWDNITFNRNSDISMYNGKLAFVEFVDSTSNEIIGNFIKVDGSIYLNVTLKNSEGATLTTADVTVDTAFDVYKGENKVASHTVA